MNFFSRHYARLHNNYRAILAGRSVYYIPDFKFMCWASNQRQCEAKFMGHRIEHADKLNIVLYVIFGYKSRIKQLPKSF